MKEKFQALNVFHRCFVISFIVSLGLFICMIPLIIFNWGEIPFGLLLGEFVSYLSYFVLGFVVKSKPVSKKSNSLIVTVLIVRVLILAIVSVGVAFLYYKYNHRIFNLFAVMGGYFIPLIVLIILVIKEKKGA